MPSFHFDDEVATAVVGHFSHSDQQPFPYVFRQDPKMDPERLAKAEELFAQLQCQQCHVLGEIPEGVDTSSLAPNLKLSYNRLRADWLIDWFKDPNALMEGTRMPQFWPPDEDDDGNIIYDIPPNTEAAGNAEEQMSLIRDYLLHIGKPSLSN